MAARKRSRSDAGPSAGTSGGLWAHASLIVGLISIVVYGTNNSTSNGRVQNMVACVQKCGSEIIKPAPAQVITQGTRLQRLTVGLNTSLHALNASSATNAQLERWSTVIYESMSASSRDFHGVDHIFEVSGGAMKKRTNRKIMAKRRTQLFERNSRRFRPYRPTFMTPFTTPSTVGCPMSRPDYWRASSWRTMPTDRSF